MLFPTFTFAVFCAAVLPVGWVLRRWPTVWKVFVLAASYYFYAAWDYRFVFLLVAMTCVNAVAARVICRYSPSDGYGRVRGRLALAVGVGFNLGVLAFFKYYGFFVASLEQNLGISGPALDIVLPIGVSFYTFQAISYVVDVSRNHTGEASFLDLAVYLSFFPQLVAGPIIRPTEFFPQMCFRIEREAPFDKASLYKAVQLIGRGLFKKVVVADFLATAIVKDVFIVPSAHSSIDVLAGVYGYAIQIYADFSGYTDIAIGVALLLGFQFPQNFDRPYAAVSVRDFWRRWHMTLSRWLRDYLYIPLGGNRKGRIRTYVNLMVTMTLGGLWHGAAGVFVVWGLYQGLGLCCERLISACLPTSGHRSRGKQSSSLRGFWNAGNMGMRRIAVFHFICAGWVVFNAIDLRQVVEIFKQLVAGWHTPTTLLNPLVSVIIIAAVAVQYLPPRLTDACSRAMLSLPTFLVAAGFAVWIMIVVVLGPEEIADYIYFQF